MKRIFSGLMMTLLCVVALNLMCNVRSVISEPKAIIVADDFPTIQEAINAANAWDTVLVRTEIYYENIVVNKSIKLVGEDRERTIIDGCRRSHVVRLESQYSWVMNFTIRNGSREVFMGIEYYYGGIYYNAYYGSPSVISNNIIENNGVGIEIIPCGYPNLREVQIPSPTSSEKLGLCFS